MPAVCMWDEVPRMASAYDLGGSWAVASRSMFVVGIVGVGVGVVSVVVSEFMRGRFDFSC